MAGPTVTLQGALIVPLPEDAYSSPANGIRRIVHHETAEQYRQRVDAFYDWLLLSWTRAIVCAALHIATDFTATTPTLYAQLQYTLHLLREAG